MGTLVLLLIVVQEMFGPRHTEILAYSDFKQALRDGQLEEVALTDTIVTRAHQGGRRTRAATRRTRSSFAATISMLAWSQMSKSAAYNACVHSAVALSIRNSAASSSNSNPTYGAADNARPLGKQRSDPKNDLLRGNQPWPPRSETMQVANDLSGLFDVPDLRWIVVIAVEGEMQNSLVAQH